MKLRKPLPWLKIAIATLAVYSIQDALDREPVPSRQAPAMVDSPVRRTRPPARAADRIPCYSETPVQRVGNLWVDHQVKGCGGG